MGTHTYIDMMENTLRKKSEILIQLVKVSNRQEKILLENEPNSEELEELFEQKAKLIQELNRLDDIFELSYKHMKENPLTDSIIADKLKELIKTITDLSVKVQAIEQRNKTKFEQYFINRKSKVKQMKEANQFVGNYHKTMTNHNIGESAFFDKKN